RGVWACRLFYTSQGHFLRRCPTSLPIQRTGDIRWSVAHSTDVPSAPASGFGRRHAASGVALRPPTLVCDGTARVAPICCLGRIVPSTTVELAASEIAPIGLVWPLDTTLDALEQAPRQLAKGGPTDRCLRGECDSYPPFSWAPSPPVGPASLVAGAPAGKAPDTGPGYRWPLSPPPPPPSSPSPHPRHNLHP